MNAKPTDAPKIVRKTRTARKAAPAPAEKLFHLGTGVGEVLCGASDWEAGTDKESEVTCPACQDAIVAQAAAEAPAQDEQAIRQPCDRCGKSRVLWVDEATGQTLCEYCLNPNRCECSLWGANIDGKLIGTGCVLSAREGRRFAQGHDAKLASLAKRAEAAGSRLQAVRW